MPSPAHWQGQGTTAPRAILGPLGERRTCIEQRDQLGTRRNLPKKSPSHACCRSAAAAAAVACRRPRTEDLPADSALHFNKITCCGQPDGLDSGHGHRYLPAGRSAQLPRTRIVQCSGSPSCHDQPPKKKKKNHSHSLLDTGDAEPTEALRRILQRCPESLVPASLVVIRRSVRPGRSRLGGVVDYLTMMAHEAMPRWAMDRFIIPWDGPRNLTLSNISRCCAKGAHSAPPSGRLPLAAADSFRVRLCPVRCASSRGSHHTDNKAGMPCAVCCLRRCHLDSIGSNPKKQLHYEVHCMILSSSRPRIEHVLARLTATAAIHPTRGSFLGCGPRLRPRPRPRDESFEKLRDLPLSGRDSTSPAACSSAAVLCRPTSDLLRPGRNGLGPRVHGRLAQRVLASAVTQASPSLRSTPDQVTPAYLQRLAGPRKP